MSILPPESMAARDSVLYSGAKPFLNTTYGHYSPVFPNPLIAFSEVVWTSISNGYVNLPWNGLRPWLIETWEQHYINVYLSPVHLYHILLVALILTIIRYIATHAILKRIPEWCQCVPSEGDKFPEAAFRTAFYCVAWTWTSYVMIRYDYFYSPYKAMHDFIPGLSIPSDVYWLYMFELGLYVHSIYATLFIEVVRRDFVVQLIHHIVTILLLGYSFSVRLYGFGVLVLFMHDGGDVLMEAAKCCVYFKVMGGKKYMLPDLAANVFFGIFVLNWILFRLYWLPCKAIYTTAHVTKFFLNPTPHYLFPNLLLWVLYSLHWYWFYYISKLVIQVIMGNEIADNREFEEEKSNNKGDNAKKAN